MKNKKLLWVLFPAFILIWGGLAYKIYKRVNPSPVKQQELTEAVEDTLNLGSLQDTFSISCNYRDPFLGRTAVLPVKKEGTVRSAKPASAPVPVHERKWPALVYYGMIKNQESRKQLILVQVDGTSTRMKPGDEVSGVTLRKVFHDSIEVEYEKERRMVRK